MLLRHRDALTAALATKHAEVVASVLEELAARGGLDQVGVGVGVYLNVRLCIPSMLRWWSLCWRSWQQEESKIRWVWVGVGAGAGVGADVDDCV